MSADWFRLDLALIAFALVNVAAGVSLMAVWTWRALRRLHVRRAISRLLDQCAADIR